jgi:hypothetical protein
VPMEKKEKKIGCNKPDACSTENIKFIYIIYIVHLEEYMVLNMKMGNGKVGRTEN